MEEILSIAKKAAQSAEVFQVFATRTPAHFEANRLKQIQTRETTGTALRLVKHGRIGFAQASGLIKPGDLVAMALDTSQFGQEVNFEFPGRQSYPEVKIHDPNIELVSIDDMITLVEQVIDAVRKHTPEILCEATASKGTATFKIANTKGNHATYSRTNFSISVDGVLVRDGDMLFVGDVRSSCSPITDHSLISAEIIRQLDRAKRNASITSCTLPVIFTPYGVAGSLLAPLISALNGKTVFDGASPLKDKLGAKILDEKFSLVDDPTIPYGPGSLPFDDEGVPARKNALIVRGLVNQFYYDLRTAALAGTISTGNGSRNGGMPSPSPHALIIDGGEDGFDSMVKNIKEGIIIEQLMGAEQGNILNGDFSGNVLLGYKIENGEITGRIKDTMVSGNVYQLLKAVEALGNDSRWIAGYVRTPSIFCPAISVATK